MSDQDEGASKNERLLASAKTDNVEMLEELIEEGGYDINFQDGLGNTALHYASQYGSTEVLDLLLDQEDCDVDLQNRLNQATPLHLAVKLADPDTRHYVVQSLLDAGANTAIKNRFGQIPFQLIAPQDEACKKLFRDAEAQANQKEDVADDSEEVDSDDVASD